VDRGRGDQRDHERDDGAGYARGIQSIGSAAAAVILAFLPRRA
jgi:hypothetical protein